MAKFIISESWDREPSVVDYALNPSDERIRNLRNSYENIPSENLIFNEICIETISRCNGKCSFCPVNIYNEPRDFKIMEDNIWKKIIDELNSIGYEGRMFPYINNEILLDKKIFSRLEYAREALNDQVEIMIETNGQLLLEKNGKGISIMKEFAKYVDQITINDYANSEYNYQNYNPHIRYLIKNIDQIDIDRDVRLIIVHRYEEQLLSNRFGYVDGHKNQTVPENELFCDFPFKQININPFGDMFICCRDSYYGEIIGNIKEKSIMEIWFGSRYSLIRDAFLDNKRICDVCKGCTSSGTISI